MLACLELIHNGVTCYMEAGSVLEPDAAADASETIGIRASLTDPLLWDIPENSFKVNRAPVSLDHSLEVLGSQLYRNKNLDSLISGHVAVFGCGSASEGLMQTAKVKADENNAVFAMHQSLNIGDTDYDDSRFNKHPLLYYSEIGLLGPNCTFTHMNVIREDEIKSIVESEISVVRNPAGSMNWGVGKTTRGYHAELYAKGVNVALGSDAARYSAEPQGFYEYFIARDKGGASLDFENILEMMTICGARAIGLQDRIGSLEPGKRADLVIRNFENPEAQPGIDLLQDIILCSRSKSIDTVIIDGRIVLKNGTATLVDDDTVAQKAREATQRMMERIGIGDISRTRWPIIN